MSKVYIVVGPTFAYNDEYHYATEGKQIHNAYATREAAEAAAEDASRGTLQDFLNGVYWSGSLSKAGYEALERAKVEGLEVFEAHVRGHKYREHIPAHRVMELEVQS